MGAAMVLGTILIVTGPTVIGPVLRWEGILIDPLGAMLALLMFEAGLSSSVEGATHKVIEGLGQAVLVGILVLVDINPAHVVEARRAGLPALVENILAEALLDEVALEGIGRLLALPSNDEVNALAALRFAS
jgi:energy-converting hydrogenase Eha subunit E